MSVDTSTTAEAPTSTNGGGFGPRALRGLAAISGVLPFAVYTLLFLGLPVVAIIIGAFTDPETGDATLGNLGIAASGIYLQGFITSIELAIVTAVIPGVIGIVVAYAVQASGSSGLRRVVSTASGVFANFGGVPLAFLFIATLGSSGLAVDWLKLIGFNPYDHGFSLYTFSGVSLVYMYFQIPLMVLVITPALEGL